MCYFNKYLILNEKKNGKVSNFNVACFSPCGLRGTSGAAVLAPVKAKF